MNIKIKSALIVIVTLMIGILIGAMINRAFLQRRIKRAFEMRKPPMFIQSYLKTIAPDPDQRKLIEEILEKNAGRVDEIRDEFRAELEASMDTMREELELILTPEQMERLTRRQPGMTPFEGRTGFRDIGRELDFLKEELDLSEDQAGRVRAVLEELRKERMGFRRIGRDRREGRESFQEMRKMFEDREKKKDESILDILTPDQKKIYKELRNRFPGRPSGRRH